MKVPKLFTAGVLGLGLILGSATAAGASTNVNLALSITGAFQHNSAHVAFQTNNDTGLVVGDANRAQAVSVNCASCKTVAVAVQIDLAVGPVTAIRAGNVAIAQSRGVVNSDTCASAYQFIVAPDEMVVFTPTAKAQIATVAAAVTAEARSTADCATITATVDSSMNTLAGVLTNPASYAPGTPTGHVFPSLNVNRYQSNQSA